MRGLISLLALSLVACAGLVAEGHLLEIQQSYEANDCATAIALADESPAWIIDRPELTAQAYLVKGKCLERMKRTGEAEQLYRYVSEQHPTSPAAYEARARLDELTDGAGD